MILNLPGSSTLLPASALGIAKAALQHQNCRDSTAGEAGGRRACVVLQSCLDELDRAGCTTSVSLRMQP